MQLTILGTGNVASALGTAFIEKGHSIVQVYGRNIEVANKMAAIWGAEGVADLKNLKPDSDIFLFCLSDDAIAMVAAQITFQNVVFVHTSGSVPLETLKKHFGSCGVIYPLQTLSINRNINFTNVPLCIEASNKPTEEKIKDLAKSISHNVHFVNSQQRAYLHLAAVFASNFTNSLFVDAATLLEEQNLSFRLLHPLILETAMKAIEVDPRKAQTGPALRNDTATIKKHLQLLQTHNQLEEIYKLITQQIQFQQKK